MTDYRQPILIAPRLGSVSTPIAELFNRFNIYGQKVSEATHGSVSKFLILGNVPNAKNNPQNIYIDYLYIGKNPLKQLFQIIRIVNVMPRDKYCFIAGDIWLGGILILFLKLLYPSRARNQMSIHGIPNFSTNFLIRAIKIFIFRQLLSRVDTIRVVSLSLVSYLSSFCELGENRFFISPVPVAISKLPPNLSKTVDIAVVGRLHEERGILEATDILKNLLESNGSISVEFIGAGPLEHQVESWRLSLSRHYGVTSLGKLSHSMVIDHLSRVRVLLSCAPEEGYGLSLREALICGVFVVARKNSGTQELQEQYPRSVFLFESPEEAIFEILQILNNKVENFEAHKIFEKQKSLDDVSLQKLTNSWIN